MWHLVYLVYSVLLAALLLFRVDFLFRNGLSQRLGQVPEPLWQPQRGAIWIHAVSVGEVLAVAPLVQELRRRFPGGKILVSTTTHTGQEMAARRLACDGTFYFPLAFAFSCRRALRAVKPALVIIVESELWPHFLRESHRVGAQLVLVNGRISDRSFGRYRFWRYFVRQYLQHMSIFLMQSEEDGRRIRELGAPAERVAVGGNLKFDLPQPKRPAFLDDLVSLAQSAPIVVAGSTLPAEEEKILQALEICGSVGGRRPLLVLAPRHPERFEDVVALLQRRGVSYVRRSQGATSNGRPAVFLLDTLGELAGTYAAANVAFVGGSLVRAGGHNPIEPALWGKPVLFGPSMENFRGIAQALVSAHAAFQVNSPDEMGVLLAALLSNPEACHRAGAAGRALVERERGAAARCAARIAALIGPAQGGAPS